MVQQQDHQSNPAMPNFIQRPQHNVPEIEMTAPEAMNAWVWPVTCWIMILLNAVIGFIAILDMAKTTTYSWPTHFFMVGCFALSFAAIAFVHKVILRGK